ncbi:hypothetical protein [Amycolatopsis sp. NPDC051903]|uniref:hypothetical protein n=1 Tax=Amycolatopsis sp. NPDC051903 TaxID=3363936 RepID=UPI0037958ECC
MTLRSPRPRENPLPPWHDDPTPTIDRRYAEPADPDITLPAPRVPVDERCDQRRGLAGLAALCLGSWRSTARSVTVAAVAAGLIIAVLHTMDVSQIDIGPIRIVGGAGTAAP